MNQRLEALGQRREVLLTALRNSPQTAAPALPLGVMPVRRAWPAQQLLLAVGALLVVVAASVFLAVAWDVIGVGGQVAVMALLTLAAGGLSALVQRRGLRVSAEVLAALTVALALIDAAAAHWLNLAGLNAVDPLRYAAWVAVGLALVLVVVSPPILAQAPATYRVAAALAAAAAPLLALVAAEPSLLVALVVLAAVAALAGLGSRRLAGGWAHYRRPLAAVFGGYLVLTWFFAPAAAIDEPLLGQAGLSYAVALVVAVGAGWAAGLGGGLKESLNAHPVLTVITLVGGAGQLVALAAHGGVGWVALLAVGAAMVPAIAAGTAAPLTMSRLGVAVTAARLTSAGALVVAAWLVVDRGTDAAWAGLTVALAGICCTAAVVAARRPRLRRWSTGVAAATGAAAVGAATVPLGSPWYAYAMAAAAVALVAVCAALPPRQELVVGCVAAVTGLAAAALAGAEGLDAASAPLGAVLAGLGLAALAYGIRPRRGLVAWAGVVLCSAGNAVWMAANDIAVVEAYSLPLAGLAMLVGLVRLRRDPAAPSWLTVGPAASAALVPSACATIGDPSLTRPVIVLVVAAAVMVGGVALRWQALFVSGALAACTVALAQLAPYAVGLPRWLTFGAVGVALLVVGFRYEQRRRDMSHAVRWVAALR